MVLVSTVWTLVHCRGSIGGFKSVPMKKQTSLHLGWSEEEFIFFSKCSSLCELFLELSERDNVCKYTILL